MVNDVTPFLDQEQIQMDVAQAKYCLKIDLSDACEKIRVEPNDIWKTVFSNIFGTFLSNKIQQGE